MKINKKSDSFNLVAAVSEYYAARAPVYDEMAGYTSPEGERLRIPIKARYREVFAGHNVLEIACGTGYWTEVIADSAKSVLGTDNNPVLISQAKDRCGNLPNAKFQIADAYTLEDVPAGFTAAFGHWWWSHIPLERVNDFLSALHSRMLPGTLVMFVDQLPYDGHNRREDRHGNTLEQRMLPDGRSYEIVKNFPSEEDILNILADKADNIKYVTHPDEKSWSVTYNTKKL